MLQENDDRFEQYLRGFEPLPPPQLPEAVLSSSAKWGAPLATAAMIILSIGMVLWRASLPHEFVPSKIPTAVSPNLPAVVTLGGLNRLLRDNPAKLDAVLSEESRALLPTVQGATSTLKVLAKD